MGRKDNSKAKERKLERKAMEMKMNAGWTNVNKANDQSNPLEPLPSFKTFNKNGVDLVLTAEKVTELDKETKEWICDLMERNMKEMYVKSEWGWSGENKRKELMEEAAWYLIAREVATNKPVAFSHYRSVVRLKISSSSFLLSKGNNILSFLYPAWSDRKIIQV